MNTNLVTDIITISNPVVINNNAITKRQTLEETLKVLDHSWYDSTQVANIFYFWSLKEKHRIPYDSDKEYSFLVHIKPEITKF